MRQASSFRKDHFMDLLRQLLGDGLLTNEEPQWRRQRKLCAPVLTRRQIGAYAEAMVEESEQTRDELDEVLGQGRPALEHMRALPYTEAIIKETMRLSPPAWIIGREALEDVQIGPWTIPAGAQIVTSQWIMHRDPRYFEDPLTFRPERWLGGQLEDRLPRFAYFPFGGGPRICIGNHFAMMESMLALAVLCQRWRFELVDARPMTFVPAITLRTGRPVPMRVAAR